MPLQFIVFLSVSMLFLCYAHHRCTLPLRIYAHQYEAVPLLRSARQREAKPLHLIRQNLVCKSALAGVPPLADAAQAAILQPFQHCLFVRLFIEHHDI